MRKIIFSLLTAFLLISCSTGNKVGIVVSNPLDAERINEMVEINYNSLLNKLMLSTDEQFVITDASANEVPYQIVGNKESVIFPVTISANGEANYTVKKGTPAQVEPKVYGRLVPERKDDFTWENDKMAYRVYGPALEATGEISSGIDVWAKRTDKLVVEKWYADEFAGISSYHTDTGEGLDFYKVGPTLGAGAAAPYINDTLWYSNNFTGYEILDNGPLRISVKFSYAPYTAGEVEVTPTRIISLDAGCQLNKVVVSYDFKAESLPIAAGLVMRNLKDDEATHMDANNFYATYKEPTDPSSGTLYTGFVGVKPFSAIKLSNKHLIGIQSMKPMENYMYYAGSGWSKNGFETYEDWNKFISDFSAKVNNPLQVKIQ